MLNTIEECRRIAADCASVRPVPWPFKPIPGTALYPRSVELGFQPPETLEGWGRHGEYHLWETQSWPGQIPDEVLRARKAFEHYDTLSLGMARGRNPAGGSAARELASSAAISGWDGWRPRPSASTTAARAAWAWRARGRSALGRADEQPRPAHGPDADADGMRAGAGPRKLRPLDPRTYAWNMAALVERGCPLCNRPGTARFVRPYGLELCLCGQCGTYFVSPAPDEAQLRALYDGYHDKLRVQAFAGTKWHARARAPSMARPEELVRHIQSRAPLEDLRIQELSTMLSFEGQRVLDVGCGTGAFLWALERLGARGTGVDVDPLAVALARERLGLGDVRCGSLERVAADEQFDLVALQDIVEHVLRRAS